MLLVGLSGPPVDSGVSLYAASRFLVGQAREGLLALASLFLVLFCNALTCRTLSSAAVTSQERGARARWVTAQG